MEPRKGGVCKQRSDSVPVPHVLPHECDFSRESLNRALKWGLRVFVFKCPQLLARATLQKRVGDFCCEFRGFLPGIFLENLSGHFFHRNEDKTSGDKIRQKIRRPKKNISPRKIRSAKQTDPNNCLHLSSFCDEKFPLQRGLNGHKCGSLQMILNELQSVPSCVVLSHFPCDHGQF